MARTQAKVERHAHGCKNCRTYYEDVCEDKTSDGLCSECRMGHCWEVLVENRRPKDCCLYNSSEATKDQVKLYKLAGSNTWWICGTCARVQVYDCTKPIEGE